MADRDALEASAGTYILWLSLDRERCLQIGRLGRARFAPGIYGYVGSAFGPGGVRARLGRHLRKEKRKRWHIDYLRAAARLEAAWVCYDSERHEHHWATRLMGMRGAKIPLSGFGSSDCDCETHLVTFGCLPSLTGFRRGLAAPVPAIQALIF